MFLNYGKTIFFLQLIPQYDMVTVGVLLMRGWEYQKRGYFHFIHLRKFIVKVLFMYS